MLTHCLLLITNSFEILEVLEEISKYYLHVNTKLMIIQIHVPFKIKIKI